ncbi:hypothetical protein QF045_005552, partial [Pseudomonas sp. W4I3]|nr:hypothetical protein [Pseudomonas sp. W4I3]
GRKIPIAFITPDGARPFYAMPLRMAIMRASL